MTATTCDDAPSDDRVELTSVEWEPGMTEAEARALAGLIFGRDT